jgi:hypothetical protein
MSSPCAYASNGLSTAAGAASLTDGSGAGSSKLGVAATGSFFDDSSRIERALKRAR